MCRLLPLVFLALFSTGCVSAEGLLKRGRTAEAEQRFEQAARYYIDALQKEPGLTEALHRLRLTGPRAVTALWADADALEGAGDFDGAIARLDALQSLIHDAVAVGVPLEAPTPVAERRDVLQARALERMITKAEQAEALGQWERALAHYRDALRRYRPGEEQVANLHASEYRVLLRWAETLLAESRFRAAYTRAEEALNVPGTHDTGHALALQQEALAEGTLYVAPLSVIPTEKADPPATFLTEFNDLLDDEFWAAPPLFLGTAAPAEVRRVLRDELRRRGYDRSRLTVSATAEIGQRLGVDFVVLPHLKTFSWEEANVKEERRRARTRTGQDTTYTVRSLTLRLSADVAYRVVDAQARRVVFENTATARVEQPLRYAMYQGDASTLTLSRDERALFDADLESEAEAELGRTLRPALARELSRRVFEQILQRVP